MSMLVTTRNSVGLLMNTMLYSEAVVLNSFHYSSCMALPTTESIHVQSHSPQSNTRNCWPGSCSTPAATTRWAELYSSMAGRASSPRDSETARKKSKFLQPRKKTLSGHRSAISRISGLFYNRVLVIGGDTPPCDVVGKVGRAAVYTP